MTANVAKDASTAGSMDWLKYAVSFLLIAGGLFAFYWFSDWNVSVRALVLVISVIVAGALFLFTGKGRQVRHFIDEARFELRKVVWPTRDLTIKATGMIIVVVLICGLIMWVFDFFIANGISLILGS